jgi:hypothetical protein
VKLRHGTHPGIDLSPIQRARGLPDEMAKHPHALFGEPDTIADEFERRRGAYGISYVTVGNDVVAAFAPVVAQLTGR